MLALQNKTVLITRPQEQSVDFFLKLEKLGAKPIEFPLIKLIPINQVELVSVYKNNNFDWIIFTSYNAIDTFFKSVNPNLLTSKIAVVGSKTEEALKKYNLSANYIASNFTAETLANEIPVTTNDTIFIPQSAIAKNKIARILKHRKVHVTTMSTYQNVKVIYTQQQLSNIFSQKIDFITFTSGSTIEAFVQFNIELSNTKVICIGPETAKAAEANNLKVDAVANPYTIEGIINSVISFN